MFYNVSVNSESQSNRLGAAHIALQFIMNSGGIVLDCNKMYQVGIVFSCFTLIEVINCSSPKIVLFSWYLIGVPQRSMIVLRSLRNMGPGDTYTYKNIKPITFSIIEPSKTGEAMSIIQVGWTTLCFLWGNEHEYFLGSESLFSLFFFLLGVIYYSHM